MGSAQKVQGVPRARLQRLRQFQEHDPIQRDCTLICIAPRENESIGEVARAKVVDTTLSRFKSIDVLVNSAGVIRDQAVH